MGYTIATVESNGYRVSLEQDDSPDSPGGWSQPLKLVLKDKVPNYWEVSSDSLSLYCNRCGNSYGEHPSEHLYYGCDDKIDPRECPEKDCRENYCPEWIRDPDIATFILWDSRGQGTQISAITDAEALEESERDHYRGDVIVGALMIDRGETDTAEWYSGLDPERDTDRGPSRAKVIASVLEEWSQWANGDVYGLVIEHRADCGHWSEEVESLWGLYGYEYATSKDVLVAMGLEEEIAENVSSMW